MPGETFAFLSYAHSDNRHLDGFIAKIHRKIEGELGARTGEEYCVFRDELGIGPGDVWSDTIQNAVRSCRFFIAFITPSYLNSESCRQEAEIVLQRLKSGECVVFIPIRLMECVGRVADTDFARAVFSVQYMDCSSIRNNNVESHEVREFVSRIVSVMLDRMGRSNVPASDIQKEVDFSGFFVVSDLVELEVTGKKKIPDDIILSRDYAIPIDHSIDCVQFLSVTDGEYCDAIVFGKKGEYDRSVVLISYDVESRSIRTVYSSTHSFAMVNAFGHVFPSGSAGAVIIEDVAGSGGYLHYVVISMVSGAPSIILERDLIFSGHIDVVGDSIVEMSGNQGVVFKWMDGFFICHRLDQQPIFPRGVNDVVFQYSIDSGGKVCTESMRDITLSIGQGLQIVRLNGGVPERILYSGGCIEYRGRGMVMAKNRGIAKVTIIPGGYEWEDSLVINVEVK